MYCFKVLLASLILLLPYNNVAQALSDDAQITLLTCGPGNELYSVFGHTALRVYDPVNNLDKVYNYGTFDFDTPNFYLKFIKGDLQYYVSASSYDDFVNTYVYYKRDVYEQVLNLTELQKQGIFNELESVLNSDRKYYTYKFIGRNCTTMALDVINLTIDGTVSKENSNKGKTYRQIIYEYLHNNFYENLGINLMFGYPTDKMSTRLFLPQELLEGVENTESLVREKITVYKSVHKKKKSIWNNIYTFAAAILIIIFFSRKKIIFMSWLAIAGLLGVFFCTVGYYSYHEEITQNYNALLFNPLFLFIPFFIIYKKRVAIYATSVICLILIFAYFIIMLNKPHLIMILPVITLNAIIMLRLIYRNRKFAG